MRSCRPFASPSSKDEIQETKALMDEASTPEAVISHVSALVRSEDIESVLHSLDFLQNDKILKEHDQKVQTAFLTALALYRLHRDDECLKEIKTKELDGITSKDITGLRDALVKETQDKKAKQIASGAGIGATIILGIGAIVALVLGTKKRR